MEFKFFKPEKYSVQRVKKKPGSNKLTHVITAVGKTLIVHEFETEILALSEMPFITEWEKWEQDKKIRYHSKKAIKYWNDRNVLEHIQSTWIIHSGDEKIYRYNQ